MLVVASSNQALKLPKPEMVIDKAIWAFEFQLKCLSTCFIFLYRYLHQSESLGMV
jgi:hypothetical protein